MNSERVAAGTAALTTVQGFARYSSSPTDAKISGVFLERRRGDYDLCCGIWMKTLLLKPLQVRRGLFVSVVVSAAKK